jgi:hypothetical protein
MIAVIFVTIVAFIILAFLLRKKMPNMVSKLFHYPKRPSYEESILLKRHISELGFQSASEFLFSAFDPKNKNILMKHYKLHSIAERIERILDSTTGVPYLQPTDLEQNAQLKSLYKDFLGALHEVAAFTELGIRLKIPFCKIDGEYGVKDFWDQLEKYAYGHPDEEWRIKIAKNWRKRLRLQA